jgi:hypothetical protein
LSVATRGAVVVMTKLVVVMLVALTVVVPVVRISGLR